MGKNLSNVNEASFTGSQSITFENVIPSGIYTVSAVVESTDTDGTYCLMLFTYEDDTTQEVNINRNTDGERVSTTTTFDKNVKKVRLYAGQSYSTSTDDTATFSQFQIEAGEKIRCLFPTGVVYWFPQAGWTAAGAGRKAVHEESPGSTGQG